MKHLRKPNVVPISEETHWIWLGHHEQIEGKNIYVRCPAMPVVEIRGFYLVRHRAGGPVESPSLYESGFYGVHGATGRGALNLQGETRGEGACLLVRAIHRHPDFFKDLKYLASEFRDSGNLPPKPRRIRDNERTPVPLRECSELEIAKGKS